MNLDHFELMCDDTGLLQHAIHSVPDRLHGYCVDDNARALLVASALNAPGELPMSKALCVRFAAFVQHAWNRDRKRFRNFMSFDRRWLEDDRLRGQSWTVALGTGRMRAQRPDPARRGWAKALFLEALPAVEAFASPRAWAFTLLGLDAYIRASNKTPFVLNLRRRLAEQLVSILASAESQDWVWFEKSLAYENARMPQALIISGIATNEPFGWLPDCDPCAGS